MKKYPSYLFLLCIICILNHGSFSYSNSKNISSSLLEKRAEEISKAKSILELENVGEDFILSSNSQFLAVLDNSKSENLLKIYNLSFNPPNLINIPNLGQISTCFIPNSSNVWLGTKDGTAYQFDLKSKGCKFSINFLTYYYLKQLGIDYWLK